MVISVRELHSIDHMARLRNLRQVYGNLVLAGHPETRVEYAQAGIEADQLIVAPVVTNTKQLRTLQPGDRVTSISFQRCSDVTDPTQPPEGHLVDFADGTFIQVRNPIAPFTVVSYNQTAIGEPNTTVVQIDYSNMFNDWSSYGSFFQVSTAIVVGGIDTTHPLFALWADELDFTVVA